MSIQRLVLVLAVVAITFPAAVAVAASQDPDHTRLTPKEIQAIADAAHAEQQKRLSLLDSGGPRHAITDGLIEQQKPQAVVPTPPPPPAKSGQRSAEPPLQPGLMDLNIRIDVTISAPGDPPFTKPFSMTVVNSGKGSIRTRGLMADAQPRTNDGSRIRLNLSFNHDLPDLGGGSKGTANLSESLNILLDSGKPMVAAEHIDPSSNRKLTVEVKATILK